MAEQLHPPGRGEGAPAPELEAFAAALERLLSIEAEEHALRRLVGALCDTVPAFDSALLVAAGERPDVVASVGVEGATPGAPIPLAAEALAAGTLLLRPVPGAPFPDGTRLAAAAPGRAGETRCALLAGTRAADAFERADLVILRAASDRAALAIDRGRLARDHAGAEESAGRALAEVESRRKTVDFILGIVGHDLRNPLGAIHISAALLHTRGNLGGWQARAVERLRSSAGRMERIIADLLSYTRTRIGKGIPIARREANLEAIARKVVDELAAVNPSRGITIESSGDVRGEWDPDRLEQVASNLVSNAVDHGDPDAPVSVEVRSEGETVVLSVANRGPGLPPEVIARLFEPFARGPEATSRKGSGLGLGLYIAREIARAHGGEVVATSGPETIVEVRLPRRGDPDGRSRSP